MTTLRPCPHRELLPGPDATEEEIMKWSAELDAQPCPRCEERLVAVERATLPTLPVEVGALLAVDGRAGAARAQAELDALAVPEALHRAIAARLAAQPGTGPWWRRWWAGWREGALLDAAPAPIV